ncbi:MAG TPA: glutathione synthase [Gammaproteobacteria bacterium]|nr:glutathione synthase [Gammaproteobacteria bacterium]
MTVNLGVVMDPIARITPAKDTTLALLLAAQQRGWRLHYLELGDLWLRDGAAWGASRRLRVHGDTRNWFELGAASEAPLAQLDAILMRKDPPFDMEYIYATYLLEQAEREGVLVVNRPRSLRDANEKLFTAWFPHCTPPTLVTRNEQRLRKFITDQGDAILKPLDGMGGASIFRLRAADPNTTVAIETLTRNGSRYAMAQRYLPEVAQGDKRILLIDGEPLPHLLARIPAAGETRANLAAGGTGHARPLGERDRWICAQVGPALRERGLLFVGLDVIGDYLTEINVTSPTGARELERQCGISAAQRLIECVAERLK